jgi:hypothetical protein
MDKKEYLIEKYAGEEWGIGFKFYPPDLNLGETITDCITSVSPSGLELHGDTIIDIDNRTVTQVVRGGTSGVTYTVTFNTTISNGYVFVDNIIIRIK